MDSSKKQAQQAEQQVEQARQQVEQARRQAQELRQQAEQQREAAEAAAAAGFKGASSVPVAVSSRVACMRPVGRVLYHTQQLVWGCTLWHAAWQG